MATPNLSFGEIRSLMVPRLGGDAERALAREEAAAHKLHARSIRRGTNPSEAARALEIAVRSVDNAVREGTD